MEGYIGRRLGQEVINRSKERIVSAKVTFPEEKNRVLLCGSPCLPLEGGEGPWDRVPQWC